MARIEPSHHLADSHSGCLGHFSPLVCQVREDVKIHTYKPHTNHKRSSTRSHTLDPTTICDFSHSLCWSPLTDLGHMNSVTYVCHPLWFVCGHRKGILKSPLTLGGVKKRHRQCRGSGWVIRCWVGGGLQIFPIRLRVA